MGNPLVCNFFKEMGLLQYVKVDVHVRDLIADISLQKKLNKQGTIHPELAVGT